MELNKKYGNLGTQMCIVNFTQNNAHIILTNPSSKPIFIGTSSILGSLKLKNLCNPWFAIQTNHLEWTTPTNEACFMAKATGTDVTPRHIGFRELAQENLPEFYANSSECIDTRYIPGVPTHVADNKRGELRKTNKLLYPFLEEDDKKLDMTEEEIVSTEIDFSETRLSTEGQKTLRGIISVNKESFSLYGEVGTCKSAKPVSFDLKNHETFNIRPFQFSVQEKVLIEKEVDKLVRLGIMKPVLSEFSSPC